MRGRQTMAKVLGKPSPEDVKRVAVAALVAALDDGKEKARKNPRMTGMRAVATGAVLYTAGRAVVGGSRFVREHLNGEGQAEEEEPEDSVDDDEDYADDEEDDVEDEEEPEDEPEDEDVEDDEEPEDEPEAEEDEDFE